jgi:hypothetical protein
VFQDNTYNNKYDSVKHPNTNPVFFYHSPQLPQLIVKQAHVTARFLMRPENTEVYQAMTLNDERSKVISLMTEFQPPNHSLYERGIVPAIYPALKKYSFQAGKPDRMFLGSHDAWFYNHHSGTKIWEMMQSDLLNLINSLDQKFLTYGKFRGLLGLKQWKKFYHIGPVTNFIPQGIIINADVPNVLDDTTKATILKEIDDHQ